MNNTLFEEHHLQGATAIISASSIASIDPTPYDTRKLMNEVDVHGVDVIYNSNMKYEEFKKQIWVLQHGSDFT